MSTISIFSLVKRANQAKIDLIEIRKSLPDPLVTSKTKRPSKMDIKSDSTILCFDCGSILYGKDKFWIQSITLCS
jgi:hypothetical protein